MTTANGITNTTAQTNAGGPDQTGASATPLNVTTTAAAATALSSTIPTIDNTQPNINPLNPPATLTTFVYSPQVKVVIAQGVNEFDVSADLIRGQLIRQENSAASFIFTLQNSGQRYTPINSPPLFSRMDRVVVYMKKTSWLQVFSGYLDQVPYKQLYPGPVDFKATCTIKRLMHTWWDPALQNNIDLLNQYVSSTTAVSADTGLGALLTTLLMQVGGWSAADIHVQNFPTEFWAFMQAQVGTLQGQGSSNMTALETMLLGSNLSPGPGAYAGANANAGTPGSYAPTAATAGGLTGTPFYVTQIVAACDDAGMGPTTTDNTLGAALMQAGTTGATSESPFSNPTNQEAWDQVQQSGESLQETNRNSDAAILGVATAMTETGNGAPLIRNLCNTAVIGSDAFPNDGPTDIGTSCGIMMYNTTDGNVSQLMNPKQSAGIFFNKISTNVSGWRNMDPGTACQQAQQAQTSAPYTANIETATSMVQAYRATLGTAGDAVASIGIPGTSVGASTAGQVAAGLAGDTGQTVAAALGGATSVPMPVAAAGTVVNVDEPQPNSEGAINFGMTCLGQPYVWGGTGPVGYDCLHALTKVMTERGEVFIKDLTCEDKVLTRQGYRRVLAAWKVKDDAKVISIVINGRTLTGTPDHRIWTENRGWITLQEVRTSDTLVTCHTNLSRSSVKIAGKLRWETRAENSAQWNVKTQCPHISEWKKYVNIAALNSLEECTTSIVVKNASGKRKQNVSAESTATTSKVSGQFSRGFLTTDTQTRPTPPNVSISYVLSDHSMLPFGSTTTVQSSRDTKYTISTTTLSITISPTLTVSQFQSTGENHRQHDSHAPTFAHCVGPNFNLLLEQSQLEDSAVLNISRNFTTEVWDVIVEDVHEFFAEGVLVHNCSGLVSMCFQAIGVATGRTTQAIAGTVPAIPQTSVGRGDIVEPTSGHVVLWLGDGTILEAQQTGVPVHIIPNPYGPPGTWYGAYRACLNGGVNPAAPFNPPWTMGAGTPPSAVTQISGSGATGSSAASEGIARNLFSFQFNPGQFVSQVAGMFTGIRAFIEGEPLIEMVSAICAAGLRNWSSGPDGSFIAWYPDYWGWDGKPAVMSLADVEMKDCTINFSDDALSTHVYINGSTTMGLADTADTELAAWLQTAGVVTVEAQQDWLFQRLLAMAPGDLDAGISGELLMQRYGVRPFKATYTMAGSAELEFLIACQVFMQKWAEQYRTNISMTFMPELFPGMRCVLRGHNLEVYVAGVTHNFDFAQGFTTEVTIMAPSNPNGLTLMSSVNTAVDTSDPSMTTQTNLFGMGASTNSATPNATSMGAGSATT